MRQRSIALSDRQWQAIEMESSRLGVTMSEIVRRVLDQWLDADDAAFYAQEKERA